MKITDREAFQAWADLPLTREFLALLTARQDRLAQRWAQGVSMEAELQAQAVVLGRLSRLRFSDDGDENGPICATIADLAGLDE